MLTTSNSLHHNEHDTSPCSSILNPEFLKTSRPNSNDLSSKMVRDKPTSLSRTEEADVTLETSETDISFEMMITELHSVIHGFTLVGRANHYMPSLKAGSIVKVDRFEISRCSSMYKITDHPFLICFISLTIIDEVITGAPEINLQSKIRLFDNLQVIANTNLELLDVVGQIRSVQGSGLTKETT
ncbi:hypothetical protein F2Q70_00043306 [Brassica cretica]|uniref:DUF223 domain-containing protein n=1 Tax=Brassica cretica TaxID=69181 RepID=A0A8S9KL21_BRACR|nr:hypothetical protein F2Q70_00043306 [Brassica cretica]